MSGALDRAQASLALCSLAQHYENKNKIIHNLFCILLNLHYLCSGKIVKIRLKSVRNNVQQYSNT